LANYLRHTATDKASAETNSLSRLIPSGDRVVFLHSQTAEGEQCAAALEKHFEAQGHTVELKPVPDLTYKESRFKMRGLRSLVATLCGLIRQERRLSREVLINATGGFKAEIAYATLIGLLFDVPVYCIHEAFRDIMEMPPTPIGWDYSLLADHDDFFEWITSDLRATGEVEQRLKPISQRQEIRLLLTDEENYTLLSPAGDAFYEAYRDRLAQAVTVPIHFPQPHGRR
jgi:putative CRISPR-associated protein (TIGR02619 family)